MFDIIASVVEAFSRKRAVIVVFQGGETNLEGLAERCRDWRQRLRACAR